MTSIDAPGRSLLPSQTFAQDDEANYSVVLGGPLYQLLLRMRIVREPLDLLRRRIIVISLIAWLPLLILTTISGRAWSDVKVPFLFDIDTHVRFLFSLPLLIVAEWFVHLRFRPLVLQFIERNIITADQRSKFDRIIQSSFRLRNSILAEIVLLVLVFSIGPVSWRTNAAIRTSTWYANIDPAGMHLTWAGHALVYFALPLFQFILLRWFFRLFIWYRFLWKTSRLNLNLLPAHPDGAGGLGFLSATAYALAPLLVAQSALLSGLIANRIFYENATLMSFKLEILALLLFLLLQALAPLLFFAPALAECQRLGDRRYGTLASRYVAEFHDKWIHKGSDQSELLGTSDIQSLADLANSFAVIRTMSIVPFGRRTVVQLLVFTLLPLLPLTLTVVPLNDLIDHLLRALL